MATPLQSFGIVGYGRFGRALAELFVEAGHDVLVHDSAPEAVADAEPNAAVQAAPSLPALSRSVDCVVVAVPVPTTGAVLRALRPHLRAEQVVMDVGSVKTGPSEDLAVTLGAEIPWVATHPLFGPASLALGERPLRVVVCPNRQHPAAVAQVVALWRRLGCEVLEQDAHEHDRLMAATHALAFFVAKGLLDAGAAFDVPHAPPSARGLARTLRAVRSDAGHLLTVLHRANPYAEPLRVRLIEALTALHERLGQPDDDEAAPDPALAIPDLGERSPELRQARDLIDELDRELIALLVRRAGLARRALKAKDELGSSVRDPERERRLLDERRVWAEEQGLEPEALADIFRTVLRFSVALQERS